jgi:hypothetical protein
VNVLCIFPFPGDLNGKLAAYTSPAKVPADASFRQFQPVNKGMDFDD